jgi:hypothetical protein
MAMARQVLKFRGMTTNKPGAPTFWHCGNYPLTSLLASLLLIAAGCGQTAKPVVSPAAGQVDTYFGGPFNVSTSPVSTPSAASFDHSAKQIAVSAQLTNLKGAPPTSIVAGTFTSADTGFLAVTESLALNPATSSPTAVNPALTGAWAVEIPGAGVLANFLAPHASGPPSAGPTAMAENTACPNSLEPIGFLYVTVPYAAANPPVDIADYGIVNITTQGSDVTFAAQPFLVGSIAQTPSTATGGCSPTLFGEVTAYPLNSYNNYGLRPELISIASTGLLVSFFFPGQGATSVFAGGTGVLGAALPSSAVDVSSVISAQFNGLIFSPRNPVGQSNGYDITVLASAFGNHSATSQACSTLQTSLAANNGQDGMVPVLPSPNTIYGGEFLTVSATGTANDPTGALGSENCDVAIDLGTQDPNTNGLFPNATVFIGSNFPPASVSSPWTCGGAGVCAVSFPAAAIVGQVQGQYMIFVSASGTSVPPAQLPSGVPGTQPQPVGIYLFQKM